ncbi:Sec-independent protein translocase subunit TatA [Lysobacter capsici]|jgi:sec-independent protein translocase protein TatA|uniref:Sec-independent protein translocase subunit TatA n=1 Tax=Lysobacter capsici TaxID=435897 RepID=UPI0004493F2D|nr:Sec-independent protein translocase subunit TatA [Lysobacter capsici]MBW8808544.1 Sec-independent protein translocase subunit TatA [Lysobacter sp.]ALN88433.1 twin arginine-targeting translocase, TatA/E family protein [Lysobacter capsici]ATE74048.1 twin-arginine translocase TatA/TatE family subunit [Lysobacter capsici]QWF16848.1 Sec-independent protein translocase subunit TatA [Lysobacter capsici]UOF14725.1 Sec-independent protein translocase subunit TatA [Lysobacter capsici]
MGAWGIGHWIVVLVIVLLVFGTKRLGSVGKDLGDAVKGFKKGMQDDDKPSAQLPNDANRTDSTTGSTPSQSRDNEQNPR